MTMKMMKMTMTMMTKMMMMMIMMMLMMTSYYRVNSVISAERERSFSAARKLKT